MLVVIVALGGIVMIVMMVIVDSSGGGCDVTLFDEMTFCGDLDFFPALLKKVKVKVVAPQNQIEPDFVVDDDYSDEEIDVDEPNFDVHDQFYLLSVYSMVICSLMF
ncbi:hypothetical protein BC332_08273 [Capsicum chinense]|nr:hypothetical protein BC332_08273 [Capsicum chinense]